MEKYVCSVIIQFASLHYVCYVVLHVLPSDKGLSKTGEKGSLVKSEAEKGSLVKSEAEKGSLVKSEGGREGRLVKSEAEKGSLVKSEGGREGKGKKEEMGDSVPVKSELTTLEENGASSTTPTSVDLDL